ncbi:phage late control D family protein [Myxacorys almedinensis]|uniref:Phage late control D family protein n=1 Tax=Myxacorys almedinensis A TaxID=2690445 RepID=A0A8J7YYL7_9CYAN|nr:contractile injection system protein, VgrG/Pvc8 family [Myxacorys almedinensis]NDJ16464.1 hypothetical protein [Myxacorys almedinensis A]
MNLFSGAQTLAPTLDILINQRRLPIAAYADLLTTTVDQSVDTMGMFTLQIYTWDLVKGQVTWADDALFEIGNEVEIQMGYGNRSQRLMIGEITGLETQFEKDDYPTLVVRGHDFRYRLMLGEKTRSFKQMKESDIARKIATEANLAAQVEDTKIRLDHVWQHNQTDWNFLQTRANRINYDVTIEDKTLHFRPAQRQSASTLTLTWGETLLEFSPRLSVLSQVTQVEVRGWNPQEKKLFIGKASSKIEAPRPGSSKTGPAIAKQEFGAVKRAILDLPIASQEEADQIALQQFNQQASLYISAEGHCQGLPDLKAGINVTIAGVGRRFSGEYEVTSATHTYSRNVGYSTDFTARRKLP